MEIRQEYFEEKHDFKSRSVLFLSIFLMGVLLNYGVQFDGA
jgi:hypothetical protein